MRSRLMTALTVAIGLMILLISLLFAAIQSGLIG
jgi:HAMP domain-containing protein